MTTESGSILKFPGEGAVATTNDIDSLPLPKNEAKERAFLGAMIKNPATLTDCHFLKENDFSCHVHRLLWKCLSEMYLANKHIEPITVADWFDAKGLTGELGPLKTGYLVELDDQAATFPEQFAKDLQQLAIRRDLTELMRRMYVKAATMGLPGDDLIDELDQSLLAIKMRSFAGNEIVSMRDAMESAREELERRCGKSKIGEVSDALDTGWAGLNKLLGGLYRGELVVLAARPSVGKTLFALNLAIDAGLKQHNVFFASLEQSTVELALRSLSRHGPVDSYGIRKGDLTDTEATNLLVADDKLSELNIYFDDTGRQSAARILSNARRLKMKIGLDMVVIDYLQIMDNENSRSQRYEQVGTNALRMRQLAKELKVVVVLLSQLSRGIENRVDGTPRLSDLKESGDIEQHADCVLMLHKPQPEEAHRDEDALQVFIKKQRNGPLGDVTLFHRKRFFDIVYR